MLYAHRRQDALALLREYATPDGFVRMALVAEALLEPQIMDTEIAEAYRWSRAIGLLPNTMPCDPRMAQLLAMDT